jgi:hypothetical protein
MERANFDTQRLLVEIEVFSRILEKSSPPSNSRASDGIPNYGAARKRERAWKNGR